MSLTKFDFQGIKDNIIKAVTDVGIFTKIMCVLILICSILVFWKPELALYLCVVPGMLYLNCYYLNYCHLFVS